MAGSLRRSVGASALLGVLTLPSAAIASAPSDGPTNDQHEATSEVPASGNAPGSPPIVWYRSSEGCPDGPEFIAQVSTDPYTVRLARAGDRVDFVVTVSMTGAGATGRLERQTDAGTIAISEVQDPDCAAVANALALSLGLSLTPGHPPLATVDPQPPAHVALEDTVAAPSRSAEEPSPQHPQRAPVEPPPASPSAPPSPASQNRTPSSGSASAWHLAVLGEGVFALNPRPLWGANALVERRFSEGAWGPWVMSFGATVHHGTEATSMGDVRQWLMAARARACPVLWSVGRLWLTPCVEADLGAVVAQGSSATRHRDAGLWATVAAAGHWGIKIAREVELRGQVAARGVLNPYRMYAGGELLFDSRPIAVSVALGIGVPL